jgi:phage protein D
MSGEHAARHTNVRVSIGGVDIMDLAGHCLVSLAYTDNEEDSADDLQVRLEDRDGKWLNGALAGLAGGGVTGVKIHAAIMPYGGDGGSGATELDLGEFELDSIAVGAPPSTVTIKGTSLPYAASIRQTKRSKAWESIRLSDIAKEISAAHGMGCMYESDTNPYYRRAEQSRESDIAFLSRLCHDAALSLKAYDNTLVLFDQKAYEAADPVATIERGNGGYTRYSLSMGEAGTKYDSCRVSYTDPATGRLIEGIAYADGIADGVADSIAEDGSAGKYTGKGSKKNGQRQRLEVTAKVSNIGEAMALAAARLRLHNKLERTASIDMLGNIGMAAGLTVALAGFGPWDGRHIICQSKHTVGAGGYTTQIKTRMPPD